MKHKVVANLNSTNIVKIHRSRTRNKETHFSNKPTKLKKPLWIRVSYAYPEARGRRRQDPAIMRSAT